MKTHWNIMDIDPDSSLKLSHKTGLSPITAQLLIHRGFSTPDAARAFLHPSLNALRSPFSMKGINTALARIIHAIKHHETILVFGDYDADGVTGTSLLTWFLNHVGATVSWYIPHRINEGYSFKPLHVEKVLIPGNVNLVITVDCGSDSVEAVELAKKHGIDVVITDHHTVPKTPPAAVAMVNPKQPDCSSGLEHLAGVGVVFYLLMALRKTLRDENFFKTIPEPNLKTVSDLVALGTIADIVPLVAENRILTQTGLDLINDTPRPGLRALIESGKINKSQINTEDIAFKIAPRVNAAGRIDHAKLAFDVLSEHRITYAKKAASVLNQLNSKRQSIEKEILVEIESHLENNPKYLEKPAIVLHRQGWHLGILGIVASRIAKKYFKPVLLIALTGDVGKGSGRSVDGIDLYEALSACADTLVGFGGHAMAGGLEIQTKHLSTFEKAFNQSVLTIRKEAPSQPILNLYGPLDFDDINPKLLDELELLQPYGNANPEPLFISKDIRVISDSPVGVGHRRLILGSDSGHTDKTVMAMHFNVDTDLPCPDVFNHVIYKLQWNRWNNTQSPQMIIEDFD